MTGAQLQMALGVFQVPEGKGPISNGTRSPVRPARAATLHCANACCQLFTSPCHVALLVRDYRPVPAVQLLHLPCHQLPSPSIIARGRPPAIGRTSLRESKEFSAA